MTASLLSRHSCIMSSAATGLLLLLPLLLELLLLLLLTPAQSLPSLWRHRGAGMALA
jgi:hypothetical protein